MRTRREIHLLELLGVVCFVSFWFATNIETWILVSMFSALAFSHANTWTERRKRIEAERIADIAVKSAARMVLAIAAGKNLLVYTPDCDCPTCTVARARRQGGMPS